MCAYATVIGADVTDVLYDLPGPREPESEHGPADDHGV